MRWQADFKSDCVVRKLIIFVCSDRELMVYKSASCWMSNRLVCQTGTAGSDWKRQYVLIYQDLDIALVKAMRFGAW